MSQTLLPTLQVSLLADTGLSVSDRITKDARLKVEGVVEGRKFNIALMVRIGLRLCLLQYKV